MNSPNFPNSAFRLIVVLGYNGITDGSTYWTTICHWPNERHYDATSFSSCGCSFVLVLQDCECKTRSSTGFLRFSCCRHDSLRDDWYMFYGTQHGIDFLLLMSFPPTILLTFGKPSFLLLETRLQQSWTWCGIDLMLYMDVTGSDSQILFLSDKIWQWFLFLCTMWYIFIYNLEFTTLSCNRMANGKHLPCRGDTMALFFPTAIQHQSTFDISWKGQPAVYPKRSHDVICFTVPYQHKRT